MGPLLVGRHTELQQVSTALVQGQNPLLFGEAGVGKTTLARAAADGLGRTLFEAGALATLSWLPYLPFRRVIGRQPQGDPTYVAQEIERLVGAGILLLDDVHWADPETRAVAALLVGRVSLIASVRRGDRGSAAALEELGSVGFDLVPLEPLGDTEAADLVGRLRPGLPRALLGPLLERAGGNPLLLEELAATGEPSESLRLAVAARLHVLAPSGVESMALLALAGRPLESSLVGSGGAELVDAGLAVAFDGRFAVRHALLADAATSLLDADRTRRLHERLGRALDDPGEAARHFALAGLRAEAHDRALEAAGAATTPGERAAHLGVAAACAEGDDADALRLRAAAGLVESGSSAEALSVLETVDGRDPLVRAEACLLEYLAASELRQEVRARQAWAAADELSAGTDTDVEVLVRIESASVAATFDRDHAEALRRAEDAYRLARRRGSHLHRARQQLGTCRLWEGKPGWERLLRASIREAFERRDFVTVQDAVASLVYGLLITGQPASGRRLAARMAMQAAELKLLGMERSLRSSLCGFLWHTGAFAQAVDEAAEIAGGTAEPSQRRLAEFYLAQSLIDLGRFDEARQIADAWRLQGSTESPFWLLAELELWSGRPREAETIATHGLEELPAEGAAIFVRLAQCWARFELQLDVGPPLLVPHHRMADAAPIEERAVCELSRGSADAAAPLFYQAAELWRGRHARGELRCLWAAGESARLAGDERGALARLAAAETSALECGAVTMLARIQRSLRLAGARRVAARGPAAPGLTQREREILELVATGLSNAEIGRRLGLGRPTVVRLIATASTKLGAGSRLQAAALAARG